jgi:hypothetical protein
MVTTCAEGSVGATGTLKNLNWSIHSSLKWLAKIGTSCIAAGILGYAGWTIWLQTRDWVVVDQPVSLAVGEIRTKSFTANIPSPYLIEIEVQKTMPFDTLNCLMGMTSVASQSSCVSTPAVIDMNWKIVSDGQMVASGSSKDDRGGGWAQDTISREIGSFKPQKRTRYELVVNVLADGSGLSPANPHLKVSASPDFLEGMMFFTALRIIPAAGVLVLLGAVLLILSLVLSHREKRQPVRSSL